MASIMNLLLNNINIFAKNYIEYFEKKVNFYHELCI